MAAGSCEHTSADPPPYHELVYIRCESVLAGEPPHSLIVMWSGSLAEIPTGWHLCDGTDGTPDLRGKFVRGTESQEDPGSTGGGGAHHHTYSGTVTTALASSVVPIVDDQTPPYPDTGEHTHPEYQCDRESDDKTPLPPYVELAFIMNQNHPTGIVEENSWGKIKAKYRR